MNFSEFLELTKIIRMIWGVPASKKFFLISKPYPLRFRYSAATNVEPLPATGSITTSPSSVNISIKVFNNSTGFCVGCIFSCSLSRGQSMQLNTILPLLLNFGNRSRYNTRPYSQLPTIFIFAFSTCAEKFLRKTKLI